MEINCCQNHPEDNQITAKKKLVNKVKGYSDKHICKI